MKASNKKSSKSPVVRPSASKSSRATNRATNKATNNATKTAPEPPILRMMSASRKEAQHYADSLRFAMKVANPNSQALQTVHLTLSDTLLFNAKQDEAFMRLWLRGELALLVTFPCNWQSLSLQDLNRHLDIAMDEDEDAEDWPDMSLEERFDLIYESSLKVHFPAPPKDKPINKPAKAIVTKSRRGER